MQKGIKTAKQQLQVDNFLDTLSEPATRKAYRIQRDRYLAYAEPPSISGDPIAIQDHIESYLLSMKNEGLSWSYRTLAASAIKHYYNALTRGRLILNWTWINKCIGKNDTDNELRGYTREEIGLILKVADIKYRAIILMLASSGMRREALVQIRIDTKDMEYLEEYQLYKIKIYRSSTSKQTAFISPEASKALQIYLNDEKPTTWLFPARNLKGKIGQHLEPESVSIRLGDIAELAGLRDKKDNTEHTTGFRNEIPAVHGARHFAINALAKSKIPTEVQKLLVGHTLGKARDEYVKPSDQELLSDYLKAVPFLTIDPSLTLQAENTELKKAKSEIESLKEQVDAMREIQSDLIKRLDAPKLEEIKSQYEQKVEEIEADEKAKAE
jgi:integrase